MKRVIFGIICCSMLFVAMAVFSQQEVTASDNPVVPPRKTVIIRADTVETAKNYKLIPLMTLEFRVLEQVCNDWLSPGGKMVYEEKRNSVLIYDTEEKIAKIEQFIKSADREAVNIRIDVDKTGGGPVSNTKFAIDPKKIAKKTGTVIYRNGKRIEVPEIQQINVNDSRGYNTNNVSQFIVTKSGSPASLWSGKTIIDPTWLRTQKSSPGIIIVNGGSVTKIDEIDPDIKWADVGTSLMVVPRQLENGLIEVEIYPEISYLTGKGKKQSIRVESLSSRLTVQSGCRIPIGGAISSKRKEYTNLFGPDFFHSREAGEMMDIYLTATVLSPGRNSAKPWIPR